MFLTCDICGSHGSVAEDLNIFWHFFVMFMGPCVINVFKHDQQDATLHNGIYYYKCYTCFRRFLRPSSGAQNCICSIGYLLSFYASCRYCEWVGMQTSSHSLTIAVRSIKARQIPNAAYTVLSSWWWAEEPPETRRAFIVINTIV